MSVFSALVAVAVSAAFGGLWSADAAAPSPYAGFPLWKDVQSRHFASLGEGNLNGTRWGAYVARVGASSAARSHPCVTVAKISSEGSYGNSSGCGSLMPQDGVRQGAPTTAEISGSMVGIKGRIRGETFVAMVVSPRIHQLWLRFTDGVRMLRAVKVANRAQIEKTGLRRWGYLAVALAKDVCLEEIRGLDGRGEVILDAETHECAEGLNSPAT